MQRFFLAVLRWDYRLDSIFLVVLGIGILVNAPGLWGLALVFVWVGFRGARNRPFRSRDDDHRRTPAAVEPPRDAPKQEPVAH